MEWLQQLKDLLADYQHLLWWLGALSLVTLLLAVLLLPVVVGRLPVDYFAPDPEVPHHNPGSWWFGHILRNLLGLLLVLAGVAMLVLPGQGVLTIIAGLVLMDLPGKHRLLVRLARRRSVRRALTWMRLRRKAPPFRFDRKLGPGLTPVPDSPGATGS